MGGGRRPGRLRPFVGGGRRSGRPVVRCSGRGHRPAGGRAVVRCRPDDSIEVAVDAGEVLDEVVLRSYCIGAAHQALGWVGTEGIAVDAAGAVHDLTMRSFGILPARDMPPVTVR